jgi:uncharacterized protein YggE
MRRRLILVTIAAVLTGAAAVVLVVLLADAGGNEAPRRVLVVGATSDDRVRPDVATAAFGVTARALTAQAAMRSASDTLDRVVDAVRRIGVQEIQTRPARLRRVPPDNEEGIRPIPIPSRFVASQSIHVRVRDLEALGELIDAAVDAGATDVDGPRFALADPRAARRRAVAQAVVHARRKGRTMAEAAGLELGRPIRVTEQGGSSPVPVTSDRTVAQADGAPPIEPGTIPVRAAVTVTFAVHAD